MGRKLLITTIILTFCFSWVGCQKKDISSDIGKDNQEQKVNYRIIEPAELNEIDGVLMRIKPDTLTRTSATIVIYDYTNEDNIYGKAFHIDKKENGEWVSLKPMTEVNWNLIGYHVDEHDRLELNIGWKDMYGALPNGEYRIVKDTSKQGEMENHYFSVQFIIES